MEWLRTHPYAASIAGAGILILLGVFIVKERASVAPDSSTTSVWSGVGTHLFNPSPGVSGPFENNSENIYSDVRSGPPFYYNPTPAQAPPMSTGENNFDFDAFLAILANPQKTGVTSNDDSLLDTAYSFIPGGLISTSASSENRTPSQQTLYNYGNEAGSFIQSFENSFRNASQILRDQSEDRENPQKNAALVSLAESLAGVGDALERMEDVPSEIRAAHGKVVASYREMGEKLGRVPEARRDDTFLSAIRDYNTTVESYLKNYVALATLLSAYGVVFTAEDPGSVFTFTNVSF